MTDSMQPLQLNEVGSYGDLSARPNPDGLVVLTIPPFEVMLPFIAQQLGRDLTPSEIEAERSKAPSMVVTSDVAARMAAARAQRSGGAA